MMALCGQLRGARGCLRPPRLSRWAVLPGEAIECDGVAEAAAHRVADQDAGAGALACAEEAAEVAGASGAAGARGARVGRGVRVNREAPCRRPHG